MHARRVSNPRIQVRPASRDQPLIYLPTTTSSSTTASSPSSSRRPSSVNAQAPSSSSSSAASWTRLVSGGRSTTIARRLLLLFLLLLTVALVAVSTLSRRRGGSNGVAGQVWTSMRARVEDTVRFNSKAQVAKLAEAQDGDSEDDDDGLGEESSEAEAAVDVGIDGKHGWKTVKTAHNPKAVKCKRTIQYKMAGLHGFGSEFNLLVRTTALARYFGYTLLPVDSSQWNYGSWTAFFEPHALDCNPPSSTTRRSNIEFTSTTMTTEDAASWPWTRQPHVRWGSRRDVAGLDKAVISLFTRPEDVRELHEQDLELLDQAQRPKGKKSASSPASLTLDPSETVPSAYRAAFQLQSQVARELWKPNREIRDMVQAVEDELDLDSNAGGGSRQTKSKTRAGELTIGVHVRLGDKYMEASRFGPQAYAKDLVPEPKNEATPGLSSTAIAAYLEAAIHTVTDILLQSTGLVTAWSGRPTLIIMSDDPEAWKKFAEHRLGSRFRVVGTPLADPAPTRGGGEGELKRMKRLVKRATSDSSTKDKLAEDGGFNEITFNAMDLNERVNLTKTFVRDISLFIKHCDGLVLTASSNVGRLLLLLAGEEMAYTRIRSLDTRWFPTASFF